MQGCALLSWLWGNDEVTVGSSAFIIPVAGEIISPFISQLLEVVK